MRAEAGESMPDDFFVTNLFPPWRNGISPDWHIAQTYMSDEKNKCQATLAALCDHWSRFEEWKPSDSWHRHFISALIDEVLNSRSDAIWEDWVRALDLCAWLMEEAQFMHEDIDELPEEAKDNYGTSLKLPVSSKEHWAWQFGRIAALWPALDQAMISDLWADLFWDWPNGLAALSLIAPHLDAANNNSEYMWLGLLASWGNHKRDHFGRAWDGEAGNHTTDLSLHWLSQLGYLDGTKRLGDIQETEMLKTSGSLPPEYHGSPTLLDDENSALLLGSHLELGKMIVAVQQEAERVGQEQATESVENRRYLARIA